MTLSDEKSMLATVAERILVRVNRAVTDAEQVLDELRASALAPCSSEHIDLMRSLVFNTRSIEEIGYFSENRLICTSWGMAEGDVNFSEPDFFLRDGVGVTLNVRPLLTGGNKKLALSDGSYNVLVDPLRFVDVVAAPQIGLSLMTRTGLLVASPADVPRERIEEYAAAPKQSIDGNIIYSTLQTVDWTAVAFQPRPGFLSTLRREQLVFLPIGLMIAGLIIAAVFWQSRQRLSLKAEIAAAIRHGEFLVHYQPIMEIASKRCVGAEALVRWRRRDGSWVRPDLFIPVAEESGLIGEITELVIANVASDLSAFLANDPTMHVSINLSPQDLQTDTTLVQLRAWVSGKRILPGQIWLEITERGFMDYDATREYIARASSAGYRLSIDDFGTGYSSLAHLQNIDFDNLKIDKSFVDAIGVASPKSPVIYHIIEMAKGLSATIVAEGVETQEQADYLEANGVTLGQGWLYSKALPADEFHKFARHHGLTQSRRI
ncbi:EAL domain-containing protein [Aureimonas altamirensis]|uniref:EAL domain-containing protein n=1 Tax=Aureimonas altamirensis TaxID=370622 RepID=UPI00301AFE79